VQAAHSLVQGVEDGGAVLGEQVPVNVLGCPDLAVPHLAGYLCMSDAPEAMSSEAQTCRSSWAV
jgi:hypothetical protein